MALDVCELPAYAEHIAKRGGKDPDTVLAELRDDLTTGQLRLEDIFPSREARTGRIAGSIRLIEVGQETAILTEWRGSREALASADLPALLAEGTRRASELGVHLLITRVDDQAMTPRYRSALVETGFRSAGRRVEYKTPLAELPVEAEGRLRWHTMAEAGSACVLDLLAASSTATPDPADIDRLEALGEHLGAAYEALDPRVVQVGFLDDRAVGVLVVRVEPDGWSTLPFMGVIPDCRGRGLGREVHLRGIGTIRALGGTLYHDGTSEANTAMVRVFTGHGCTEHSRMEEWCWAPPSCR